MPEPLQPGGATDSQIAALHGVHEFRRAVFEYAPGTAHRVWGHVQEGASFRLCNSYRNFGI